MELTPKNQVPIFLSQDAIDRKFDELEMPRFLKNTCNIRKIKTSHVVTEVMVESPSGSLPTIRHRPHRTDWRAETFIHKLDGKSRAIIYWRKLATAEEERKVQQFTSQDGTFYVVDTVGRSILGLSAGSKKVSS